MRGALTIGRVALFLSNPLLCQEVEGMVHDICGSDADAEGLEGTCGRCMSTSVRTTSTLRIAALKLWCLLRLRFLDVREKVCPYAL